jgi:hypothetical protein
MSAKDPRLKRTGSHSISDNSSSTADGIGREEVHLYFSATWRGKLVSVTMSCDRYAASFHDENTGKSTDRLTDWRVYASEAHFEDPTKNGGRGEPVSGTARSALGKLCKPFATAWLTKDAYKASFQAAVGHHIMRMFRDDYSASRRVTTALAVFRGRLSRELFEAIRAALRAYIEFEAAVGHAELVISGEA